MGLRRMETSIMDAYTNLALEEAIFTLNEGGMVRVWRNETSVIIGRAQLARFETDLEYCEKNRIPVVRRFTAGGTVYNGPGNLNWSIFLKKGSEAGRLSFARDARDVFRMAASIIVEAVRQLGIRARFEEPNRVVNDEGKVSGMAAYLSKEKLLCHGTLLLGADLEEAAALTSPKNVRIDQKYVRSREARMANLGISESAFVQSLWRVIGEDAGSERRDVGPSDEEIRLAGELSKYRDAGWNLGDPFRVTPD